MITAAASAALDPALHERLTETIQGIASRTLSELPDEVPDSPAEYHRDVMLPLVKRMLNEVVFLNVSIFQVAYTLGQAVRANAKRDADQRAADTGD